MTADDESQKTPTPREPRTLCKFGVRKKLGESSNLGGSTNLGERGKLRDPSGCAFALAIALALSELLASRSPALAQTSTREAKLGTFFTYGIDAERVRLDKIQRIDRIDGRPYVRTVDAGDGRVGYLILTLTVKNRTSTAAYVPTLVTTIKTDTGPATNPAVFGPYLGTSTEQADIHTKIPPHSTAALHFIVIDIPNGHRLTDLILSPNDATPEYRFRLHPTDITPLRAIPRAKT